MQAEIISCGDELVSGKILDTNSQWLSRELLELGIMPLYHTTVGDELPAMLDVLRIAAGRADLILWTGGLGPTADDLTRQAIAELVGVTLVKNEESLAHIRAVFRRLGRDMPPANESQAFQPEGTLPIFNPHGTAPGIDMTVQRPGAAPPNRLGFYRILAYPGVPAELREMWNDSGKKTIAHMLEKRTGRRRVLRFRAINVFGLGESQVEALLPDIINRNHVPRVGITAQQASITLRIAAEGSSEEECRQIMEPTAKIIYDQLGDLVYGEGEDTLQDVVCRQLTAAQKTVAVIEIGTQGRLATVLAGAADKAQAGDFHCFAGGIVLPSNVSYALEDMFSQADTCNADYTLLVGPFPLGAPERGPTETVLVALAASRQVLAQQDYPYAGHPDLRGDLFVKRALDLLRKTLASGLS